MQTYLEITRGRDKLAACLHRPDPGRLSLAAPLVICCHGLTGTRNGTAYRMVSLARRLAIQNMACLRFDFGGCGESDRRFEDVTSASLLDDLRTVVEAAGRLPGCDPTRIGLVGSSFGAYTSARAASALTTIRCLAFWAPVSNPTKLVERDMTAEAWEVLRQTGWIEHHGLRLGRSFIEQLPQHDVPAMLAAKGVPLLVFHGTDDPQVPIEQGRAYEKAHREAGVEVCFEAVKVRDHGMRTVAATEAILEGTVKWMRRFLHPEANEEAYSI